ncbi:hypothetical protein [Actinomycetospora aeridis]|uniref:Uncharacterized protein n=1 Tax=Actinomycetospora aeridis TaxID=3129231 RepID=A0ABU8N155_9PSEU
MSAADIPWRPGDDETPGQRTLRHLWEGHGGGYDDVCPHNCPLCGGQGCRPIRPTY